MVGRRLLFVFALCIIFYQCLCVFPHEKYVLFEELERNVLLPFVQQQVKDDPQSPFWPLGARADGTETDFVFLVHVRVLGDGYGDLAQGKLYCKALRSAFARAAIHFHLTLENVLYDADFSSFGVTKVYLEQDPGARGKELLPKDLKGAQLMSLQAFLKLTFPQPSFTLFVAHFTNDPKAAPSVDLALREYALERCFAAGFTDQHRFYAGTHYPASLLQTWLPDMPSRPSPEQLSKESLKVYFAPGTTLGSAAKYMAYVPSHLDQMVRLVLHLERHATRDLVFFTRAIKPKDLDRVKKLVSTADNPVSLSYRSRYGHIHVLHDRKGDGLSAKTVYLVEVLTGDVSEADFDTLLGLCEPLTGCTGDVSLSKALSAGKLPFYKCRKSAMLYANLVRHVSLLVDRGILNQEQAARMTTFLRNTMIESPPSVDSTTADLLDGADMERLIGDFQSMVRYDAVHDNVALILPDLIRVRAWLKFDRTVLPGLLAYLELHDESTLDVKGWLSERYRASRAFFVAGQALNAKGGLISASKAWRLMSRIDGGVFDIDIPVLRTAIIEAHIEPSRDELALRIKDLENVMQGARTLYRELGEAYEAAQEDARALLAKAISRQRAREAHRGFKYEKEDMSYVDLLFDPVLRQCHLKRAAVQRWIARLKDLHKSLLWDMEAASNAALVLDTHYIDDSI